MICDYCEQDGAELICGRCFQASYCDSECQRAHFDDTHSQFCKHVNEMTPSELDDEIALFAETSPIAGQLGDIGETANSKREWLQHAIETELALVGATATYRKYKRARHGKRMANFWEKQKNAKNPLSRAYFGLRKGVSKRKSNKHNRLLYKNK